MQAYFCVNCYNLCKMFSRWKSLVGWFGGRYIGYSYTSVHIWWSLSPCRCANIDSSWNASPDATRNYWGWKEFHNVRHLYHIFFLYIVVCLAEVEKKKTLQHYTRQNLNVVFINDWLIINLLDFIFISTTKVYFKFSFFFLIIKRFVWFQERV